MLRAKFLYDDKMWIYCHVKYLRREFLDPKGKKVTTEISDLQDLWGHQVCLVHRYVNHSTRCDICSIISGNQENSAFLYRGNICVAYNFQGKNIFCDRKLHELVSSKTTEFSCPDKTKRRVSRTERFNPVTLFCRLNRVIQGWKVKRGRKVNRWVDLSIILKRAADGRSKKRNLFILNPDWTGKDERYNWPSRIIPFVEPERVVEYPSILCCELFRGLWFRRVMTSISSIATKESKAR